MVGAAVGSTVGIAVGILVGTNVGTMVGILVGTRVGTMVGILVGTLVGILVGINVGRKVGCHVGSVPEDTTSMLAKAVSSTRRDIVWSGLADSARDAIHETPGITEMAAIHGHCVHGSVYRGRESTTWSNMRS